jgi:hypothetical protein
MRLPWWGGFDRAIRVRRRCHHDNVYPWTGHRPASQHYHTAIWLALRAALEYIFSEFDPFGVIVSGSMQ